MNIVNLTPHSIVVEVVEKENGERVTFPPSGEVARVASVSRDSGKINGIPVRVTEFGEVTGIPAPQEDTIFIVSLLVAQRADRSDVVSPDTGPTAIRENGQVVAVRAFQAF